MNKPLTWVLMLCFILSGALSYASGAARTMNEEGTPILTIAKSQHGGTDRGSSIHASIDGHCLTISFSESIGQVAVEVTSVSGVVLRNEATHTPEGLLYYIPLAGDYIVTFTLANGDEYYGEFTITD